MLAIFLKNPGGILRGISKEITGVILDKNHDTFGNYYQKTFFEEFPEKNLEEFPEA